MSKKSGIPFGAQFSPNQVSLLRLLEIVRDHAGDRRRITEAVRDGFFTTQAEDQRWKLAGNTVLALRAYGLLGEDGATPTAMVGELLTLITTPDALYERFAKHILVDLRGIVFVETLATMQTADEEINLDRLGKDRKSVV